MVKIIKENKKITRKELSKKKKIFPNIQEGLVKGVKTAKEIDSIHMPLPPSPPSLGKVQRRHLSIFDTIEGTAEERFMGKRGKWEPDAEDRFWLN